MKKTDLRIERERQRRKEYKLSILKAAEDVIIRKGYSAATMDDIAREAQFSKVTLYRYFKSKAEIIHEIIINYLEHILERIKEVIALPMRASEKLRMIFHDILLFRQEKLNISRIIIMDRSFMKMLHIFVSGHNEPSSEMARKFGKRIRKKRKEIIAEVSVILQEGIASGEFRPLDIESTVFFMEALIEGYSHRMIWQEKKINLKDSIDFFLDLLFYGIREKEDSAKGVSG